MERHLVTTRTINIHTDPEYLLRVLSSALMKMCDARLNHQPKVSRCLFKFHKDEDMITFHPASYDDVINQVCFDRFPKNNTKTLLALKDLGRGSTGIVWLATTITSAATGSAASLSTTASFSAVCVLKFYNYDKYSSSSITNEKSNWDKIYPEFSTMTKVEKWSGSNALIMPHFQSVSKREDRYKLKHDIQHVLFDKFHNRGYIHPDVKWENIGFYRKKQDDGKYKIVPVIYDLTYLEECTNNNKSSSSSLSSSSSSSLWIHNAMSKLFPES